MQLNLFGEQITEGEATSMDAELLEDIMEQYEVISSSDKNKIKEIETENKGIFGASSIERPILADLTELGDFTILVIIMVKSIKSNVTNYKLVSLQNRMHL